MRPAFVDASANAAILPFVPQRVWWKRGVEAALGPGLRALWPAQVSPTRELGEVLVRLAMGDGRALEGAGVEGEGRTVGNVGLRRLAGL